MYGAELVPTVAGDTAWLVTASSPLLWGVSVCFGTVFCPVLSEAGAAFGVPPGTPISPKAWQQMLKAEQVFPSLSLYVLAACKEREFWLLEVPVPSWFPGIHKSNSAVVMGMH